MLTRFQLILVFFLLVNSSFISSANKIFEALKYGNSIEYLRAKTVVVIFLRVLLF